MKVSVIIMTGLEEEHSISENKVEETESNPPLEFDMGPGNTIEDVKKEIQHREGLSAQTQRLFLPDNPENEMENDITLDHCPQKDNKLSLVLIPEEPRSHEKCFLEIKHLDIPKTQQYELTTLLRTLPGISSVNVDREIETSGSTLRLKVSQKTANLEGNKWMKKILEGFRRQVHKHIHEPIENLMKTLREKDRVFLDITQKHSNSKFVSSEALIPHSSRKLSELNKHQNDLIQQEFMKHLEEPVKDTNLRKEIMTYIVFKLDKIPVEDRERLGHDMGSIYLSPFISLLEKFKKCGGTLGGLIHCLDECSKDDSIMKKLGDRSEENLNELKNLLQSLADEEYGKWTSEHTPDFEHDYLTSYEDFRREIDLGWTTKEIVEKNSKKWEVVKEVIEEGDQVWMWRKKKGFLEYAHVAIFVGGEEFIHVTTGGVFNTLNKMGVVKKEDATKVIGDSECYLIRCNPGEKVKGTAKERAEACLDLEFKYTATLGNCEAFSNCVSQGIFTTEKATTQRDSWVAKFLDLTASKKQYQNLQDKIAVQLRRFNLEDDDIVAHARGQDLIRSQGGEEGGNQQQ